MAGAELLGLSAIVFAQPIFDALQRSTYAFSTADLQGMEVVLLAAALILLPPGLMLVVELLVGLVSRSARGWVHLGWIAMLITLFAWQAIAEPHSTTRLIGLVIFVVGFLGAAVYFRFEAARSFVRILALAAPVIAYLFLFTAPIKTFTLTKEPAVANPKIESETPVVLVIFDEFPLAGLLDRAGNIDAGRYPNFASLADGTDWFRNAVTVADTTEQAVPAILSGS